MLRLKFQIIVIRYTVDFRRLFYRAMFIGILATVTLTAALIIAKAPPSFSAPIVMVYILTLASMFLIKPKTYRYPQEG